MPQRIMPGHAPPCCPSLLTHCFHQGFPCCSSSGPHHRRPPSPCSGSWDCSLRVWDRASLCCTQLVQTSDWVHSLALRGDVLAAACGAEVLLFRREMCWEGCDCGQGDGVVS